MASAPSEPSEAESELWQRKGLCACSDLRASSVPPQWQTCPFSLVSQHPAGWEAGVCCQLQSGPSASPCAGKSFLLCLSVRKPSVSSQALSFAQRSNLFFPCTVPTCFQVITLWYVQSSEW